MYQIKEVLLPSEQEAIKQFLESANLEYENDIDYSIAMYDNEKVIGTASLSNNVMKCFLVDKNYSGQNLSGQLFNHLVNVLQQRGRSHFFVFTTPSNQKIFQSFNMHKIVETMNTVLLEGGDDITTVLSNLKEQYKISDNKKACVIINANPMTNGHLFLIETAASENEEVLVFVVSEDLSSFPFNDRFAIIKEATKHLKNVTILPTLSYLVSQITFPKYFLQEDQLIQDEQTLVDVLVYKEYYAKIFHIHLRYLGEEPYSPNTNKYNKVLKQYLNHNVKIIPRKEFNSQAISASHIRRLIKNNEIDAIKDYVPDATYRYLLSEPGQHIISLIQSKDLERH